MRIGFTPIPPYFCDVAKQKKPAKGKRRMYWEEWMDYLKVGQELLSTRSGVRQGTLSGWWSKPTINPQRETFLAAYDALRELDTTGYLREANDIYRHPDEVTTERRETPKKASSSMSDEEILASKDQILKGVERLAAKGDLSELDILRLLVRLREQGIIKNS